MKPGLVEKILRKGRSVGTFWIAEQTLEHLEAIRMHELGVVLNWLPPGGRVLEIGAGAGWQARAMNNCGYHVSAIDLPAGDCHVDRVFDAVEYDGRTIPFADGTFDAIFSSNVLEHIPHICEFQGELQRVLKANGVVVHVLPSTSWRFWTNITHLAKWWTIPKAHGEHAGNALTELYYFSRRWWVRLFRRTGWAIVAQETCGLFYTGNSIMDSRLDIGMRIRLGRVLGGACNVFVAHKGGQV